MNELEQLTYDFEIACGPVPSQLQKDVVKKLDELKRVSHMMRLVTGRIDWRRMTTEECEAHATAPAKVLALKSCEVDAKRWRAISVRMTHERAGSHYGWCISQVMPGDDPEAAIDAVIANQGQPAPLGGEQPCVDCDLPRVSGLIRCEAHAASYGRSDQNSGEPPKPG